MKTKSNLSPEDESASKQIDAIIKKASSDWKGQTLSELRALILKADPEMVEEVKWKKPSNPAGVAVWSHDGIVCIGETLKNSVRLTFPKGARIKDPKKQFNAWLLSSKVRAVDFYENETIDNATVKSFILQAVTLNKSKARER